MYELMKISEVLKQMGLKSTKARQKLTEDVVVYMERQRAYDRWEMLHGCSKDSFVYEGVKYTEDNVYKAYFGDTMFLGCELEDFGTEYDSNKLNLVYPKGVERLLKLLEAGYFKDYVKTGIVSEELMAYMALGDSKEDYTEKAKEEINAQSEREMKAKRDAQNAYWEDIFNRLDDINPDEQSTDFLDEIIVKKCGLGSKSLKIGGTLVSKSVSRYFSNSRKTPDYDITITWTSPVTGQKVERVVRSSTNKYNRRNNQNRD